MSHLPIRPNWTLRQHAIRTTLSVVAWHRTSRRQQ